MQIGSRFTEYGLTGGFFWICQLILLWYYGKIQWLLTNLPTVQIPSEISQIGSTAITGLVSALGIIAVFVAGLLLDLFAVFFRSMEMRVFDRHLVRNRDWLCRLIADHKGYCAADYEEFERRFGGSSYLKDMLTGLDIFLFWKRERRQRYLAAMKRGWGLGVNRPYERLWSFLASYVVVMSGSSQLSLLVDQYYLWRTGRAISIVLFIVSLEVMFFEVIFFHRPFSIGLPFLVLYIFQLALTILMIMIALETYSRLCFTLFALVYVTQDKEVRNGANRPI